MTTAQKVRQLEGRVVALELAALHAAVPARTTSPPLELDGDRVRTLGARGTSDGPTASGASSVLGASAQVLDRLLTKGVQ
jgi:hypothetical protein